jgi:hypothetical protein
MIHRVKYWEIIAGNLSKAGCVSAIDSSAYRCQKGLVDQAALE